MAVKRLGHAPRDSRIPRVFAVSARRQSILLATLHRGDGAAEVGQIVPAQRAGDGVLHQIRLSRPRDDVVPRRNRGVPRSASHLGCVPSVSDRDSNRYHAPRRTLRAAMRALSIISHRVIEVFEPVQRQIIELLGLSPDDYGR
jgi:hypothetical protein